MGSNPRTVAELLLQPFEIHSINGYSNTLIAETVAAFSMKDQDLYAMLRVAHFQLVDELRQSEIDYQALKPALVPRPRRLDIAFVFNSKLVDGFNYGDAIARDWLGALRSVGGPTKSAVSVGDIIGLPSETVWRLFEDCLVGPKDFARLHHTAYFVVHFTNVSVGQAAALDARLRQASRSYLGHIDCSTWIPLKRGFPLVQVGLLCDGRVLTTTDDAGTANQVGYPFEEFGFEVVGVTDELYGTLLTARLDQGDPDLDSADTAIAIAGLSGNRRDLASMGFTIDARRFDYMTSEGAGGGHLASIKRAGLLGFDRETLESAVKAEIDKGLIYSLRSVEGTETIEGVRSPAPDNDALLFTVQVDFPDLNGTPRRYLAGIKYVASTHTGELTTLFG